MIKENKSSIHPPFDLESYIVTEVKGTQVTGNSQTRRKGKEKEKVSDKIGKGKTSAPANGDQLKKTLTQISSWVPNRKLCSTTNF